MACLFSVCFCELDYTLGFDYENETQFYVLVVFYFIFAFWKHDIYSSCFESII